MPYFSEFCCFFIFTWCLGGVLVAGRVDLTLDFFCRIFSLLKMFFFCYMSYCWFVFLGKFF